LKVKEKMKIIDDDKKRSCFFIVIIEVSIVRMGCSFGFADHSGMVLNIHSQQK